MKALIICFVGLTSALFASAQDNTRLANELNNQAVVRSDNGKYQEAVQLLERAILAEPGYALAYYNLGSAYFQLNQLEKAIEAFRHAIVLKPEFSEAYNQIGVTYLQMSEVANAIAAFREAIRVK